MMTELKIAINNLQAHATNVIKLMILDGNYGKEEISYHEMDLFDAIRNCRRRNNAREAELINNE